MKDNFVNFISIAVATIFTLAQTNAIFQLISIILTCIATLVALAYNIYKWYKNAIQDKKLDKNEVDELIDIIKDSAEEIKNKEE